MPGCNAIFIWADGREEVMRIAEIRPFYALRRPYDGIRAMREVIDQHFLADCGIAPPMPDLHLDVAHFELAGDFNGGPVYRERQA